MCPAAFASLSRASCGGAIVAAPAAAAGAVLKQLAWAHTRRQGSRLLRTFWKAIAVSALILIVAPIGLVVVGFLALTNDLAHGGGFVTGYAATSTGRGSIACPVVGAVVTQGFGPTSVLLEPPGFGYPHFHTGVDLAAPLGALSYLRSQLVSRRRVGDAADTNRGRLRGHAP